MNGRGILLAGTGAVAAYGIWRWIRRIILAHEGAQDVAPQRSEVAEAR